jgi:hypothetical protein
MAGRCYCLLELLSCHQQYRRHYQQLLQVLLLLHRVVLCRGALFSPKAPGSSCLNHNHRQLPLQHPDASYPRHSLCLFACAAVLALLLLQLLLPLQVLLPG